MTRKSPPIKIVVTKRGEEVFKAEAGRMGFDDSAMRDYTCFASPLIGASYYYLDYEGSSQRIADLGYRTTFATPDKEWSVEVTPRGERHLELNA